MNLPIVLPILLPIELPIVLPICGFWPLAFGCLLLLAFGLRLGPLVHALAFPRAPISKPYHYQWSRQLQMNTNANANERQYTIQ